MECDEVREYISAAVDGELDREIESHVTLHLEQCRACRNEFELERMTKNIVFSNLPSIRADRALAAEVMAQVARIDPADAPSKSWLDTFLGLLTWRTAFAVGGALAVFVLITIFTTKTHHMHTQPIDNDVFHQAYNNFDGILDGKIVPTVASPDPSAVKAFFRSKVNFKVSVPQLHECDLLGGVFSEYHNTCLAHVVYKHGDKIIYMYQTRLRSVMDSGCLQMPPEAKQDLERTGWYFENHLPDCSLAAWVVDSTLCCAIADVDREQLLSYIRGNQ